MILQTLTDILPQLGIVPLFALAAANPGTTSAIMSGISSIFGGKSKRKEAREAAKRAKEEIQLRGDEDRKSAAYEAQLAEYYKRKEDDDFRAGALNYVNAARMDPYVGKTGYNARMLAFNSTMPAPQAATAPGWQQYSALPPPKPKGR